MVQPTPLRVTTRVVIRVPFANGRFAEIMIKRCNDFKDLVAGVGFEPTTFRVLAVPVKSNT